MKAAGPVKRNRFIVLSFVSVLMLLMYGPFAQWFVSADRFLYDRFAGFMPRSPLNNAYIVSIDPQVATPSEVTARYGDVIGKLQQRGVARIILPNPPPVANGESLPRWANMLKAAVPVFVPTDHPLASVSAHDGIVRVTPDSDGVLRRSSLWHLHGGIMAPSLPLAVSIDGAGDGAAPRIPKSGDAIYFSRYAEIPRLSVEDVLHDKTVPALAGATVFVDADPALTGAEAVLPSGQFVTHSEMTAALMADIQDGAAIAAPPWVVGLQWIVIVLLAVGAVLLLPDRGRRDIAVLAVAFVGGLLLIQLLLLVGFNARLDVGRPILLFLGAAMLSAYLIQDTSQETQDAFKRGSDFLMAGRLEPAFAEFRRCNPSETVAAVMYKLSLAFEQQAKPERAEAVLEWLKRTHVSSSPRSTGTELLEGMPQKVGRYVIEKRIGRGAMGAVYLAKDPRINRPVALKVIAIEDEFEDEELAEARQRFHREAESAGRLTHPNIITVYDAGEDKGLAYIAMEYVPGIPLKDFTDPNRLLAPKRAFDLAAATADALDYAHNQGVIHRDIKPANLLYNPRDASLKISDFGVARLTDNNRTKTGIVLGTPMYMSPEQLGAETVTGLSDLFSLGVTLYELLIGEAPFQATNIATLMNKITSLDPEPVANRRRGIPPAADRVLAKVLAKKPEDRFSCGAELAVALRECARSS